MKMTVSYEWLCSLAEGLKEKSIEEVGLGLTSIGAETEHISVLKFDCLCAEIMEVKPLGKLSSVKVKTSKGEFTAVSNSPALAEGEFVIFAENGSEIFGGITVQPREIEGVKTDGLLLALENLGIEQKSADIFYLDKNNPQEDFSVYTAEDAVYTLDVPGNRPDWLSVRELARALAVKFGCDLKEYDFNYKSGGDFALPVNIQSERCVRYALAKISNIKKSETAALIKKRLYLLGMRPVNYLVDLSNAAMLELGQPTHAFDADKIKGAVNIRQAMDGEKMTLLDGSEISLSSEDLLICDEEKILALAGIMGGLDSGVDEGTTSVYLESASFNGVYVRRSAKRLGLKTESSLRFEKNISPALVLLAEKYICKQLDGADISEIKDVYPNPIAAEPVYTSPEEINSYLGADIDGEFIKDVIIKLGCTCDNSNKIWKIEPNPIRSDLRIKEDIMEEAARFYGYDNIPAKAYRPSQVKLNPEKSFDEKIRPILRGMGLSEAVTTAFRSEEQRNLYGLKNQAEILNPLNSDWTELRTHIFDGLIESIKNNIDKAFEHNVLLSETASVFSKKDGVFHEQKNLAFAVSCEGGAYGKALNYFKNILAYAKVQNISAEKSGEGFLHPLNSFDVYADGVYLGFFGELNPVLADKLSLKKITPVVCELNFEMLEKYASKSAPVQRIPELPPVFRDITLTVGGAVQGINIVKSLKDENPMIKDIEFLSVFQNAKLKEQNQKNISLRLRFESDKPADAQEIDNFIKDMLKKY